MQETKRRCERFSKVIESWGLQALRKESVVWRKWSLGFPIGTGRGAKKALEIELEGCLRVSWRLTPGFSPTGLFLPPKCSRLPLVAWAWTCGREWRQLELLIEGSLVYWARTNSRPSFLVLVWMFYCLTNVKTKSFWRNSFCSSAAAEAGKHGRVPDEHRGTSAGWIFRCCRVKERNAVLELKY